MNNNKVPGIGEIVLHETLIFGTVFVVLAVIIMNIWAGLLLVTAGVSTLWVLKCRAVESMDRENSKAAKKAS